jgi:hypothetical protein
MQKNYINLNLFSFSTDSSIDSAFSTYSSLVYYFSLADIMGLGIHWAIWLDRGRTVSQTTEKLEEVSERCKFFD